MLEWIISSAVLTATVIALRFTLKGKISLRLQYLLWLPVLLRLLIPVNIGSTGLSIGNLTQRAAETETAQVVSALSDLPLPGKSYQAAYEEVAKEYAKQGIDIEELPVSEYESVDYEIMARMSGSRSIRDIIQIVWIVGIAAVGLVLIVSNIRFAVKLKKSRHHMEAQSGVLPVYILTDIDTPCLFGLFRPAIYLTEAAAADDSYLRHSLCHELTHYRHGDHIWGLLRGVCLALHWYNPLIWWAAALSRKDAELACDEATVKSLGESERAAYGRTLIEMTCEKRPALLLTATTMTGSGHSIRERLTLLTKKPKTALITLITVLLVISVAAGCTFTGAKKNESSLTPDTVTMAQMLSSGPPCPPITDSETVAHLWELYRSFSFDGTTEEIGRENAWSICVGFTDSATGESESFTIFQGGLCTLGGDLETYHILHDGAAVYQEFLRYYKENLEGSIILDVGSGLPSPVLDYAVSYTQALLGYYTNELGYAINEAKITGLTPISTGTAGTDSGINMYLLECRFRAADPAAVKLVGGMQMEGDCITEWGSTGQPYLLLRWEMINGEELWERIGATNTLTLQEEFSTPEMLEKYGNMYTAAAMELYAQHSSDSSPEVLLIGFSAEAEGSYEEIGRQWAEAFVAQHLSLPPEHPLYSRSAAVLHCSLNMESLLTDPKALVFGMSFVFDAANADAFARCYVDAEPLTDAAYPQYAGWMRFGCFVSLKDSGNGKWSCIDAGSGGYGGWGYLNYDEVDQVDFRMNSMLAGEEDIPENLLRVLPFVDLMRLSADKREKLFAFLDRYCLSEGQVYGPEESRLWKDVYPEDQSYRDLYVMLAALNADGKCSEDFSAILQKQRRYDPASFESSLGALTQAQRKGIEKLI